jgi:hypothetical protein
MTDAPRPKEPSPAPYEFSDAHKESFRVLATSMSFVGVCAFLFGLLAGVFVLAELYEGFVPNAIGTAVGAAYYVVTAFWMLSAGRSLSAMLRTRGRDVEYLMDAVTQLRRLFGLVRVVIIVFAFVVMLALGAYVWCSVLHPGGRCLGLFG